MRWLIDQILAAIQRRCKHPSIMVAADILEGCGDPWEVKYCRRCGAVKVLWRGASETGWRKPDPNLWRGRFARQGGAE